MLWEAFDRLVPNKLSVDELLVILAAMDPHKRDEGFGARIYGPRLVDKLSIPAALEQFLKGLLDLERFSTTLNRHCEKRSDEAIQ